MSISDLYLSGDQQRNISHFANIVKIAKADDVIMNGEEELLKKIARRYHINDAKYKEIFNNPEKYPVQAHLDNEERIERFFDLVKMVFADDSSSTNEVAVLKSIAIGLGFPIKKIDVIIECAMKMDLKSIDIDDFHKAIMKA